MDFYGVTPFEFIHNFLLGIKEYVLKTIFNYHLITTPANHYIHFIFKTVEYDKCICILSLERKTQSDRNIPRA